MYQSSREPKKVVDNYVNGTITQISFEDEELFSSFSFFLSVSLKVSSKTLAEIFLELLSKWAYKFAVVEKLEWPSHSWIDFIGIFLAILIVFTNFYKIILAIAIVIVCIWLGGYVQRNKEAVKEKTKNFIDKL